ncbi:MAG: hypothetical protein ACI4SG_02645 [Oligosphaeraceae bacterium]
MALKKCTVGVHKDCILLQSGDVRLAVTTKVGPRVIGCFIGKKSTFNHFAVLPPEPMENLSNGFTLYGGHRLWHSPEALPRTYEPDNGPVEVREEEGRVMFSSPTCPQTGIAKCIAVEPLEHGIFYLRHDITNNGMWPVRLAAWTLAQMAPGGTCILPMGSNSDRDPFTPDRTLNLWPYTDLKDKRLKLGNDFIMVKHDAKMENPMKIGYSNRCQWVAHVNQGQALVQYFSLFRDSEYPDRGCTTECYTCKGFTEMEVVGPLCEIQPGETISFDEFWQGLDKIPEIRTEKQAADALYPHLLVDPADYDAEDEDECGWDDGGCGCGCEDDDCDCDCDCDCEDEEEEPPAPRKAAKATRKSTKKAAKKKSSR